MYPYVSVSVFTYVFVTTLVFSITVYIKTQHSNEYLDKIIINPHTIGHFCNGYPLLLLYNNYGLCYEIYKTYPEDFFWSVFIGQKPIKSVFIYGNVKDNIKNIIRTSYIYHVYIDYNNTKKIILCYDDVLINNLSTLCTTQPYLVNSEFSYNFVNSKYKYDDILPQFIKTNSHWSRIDVKF